ncbi:prolyl oligopeptidase family protein [Flavihumibacter sp. ZG627]|uniref:prolyl oligopeptidase family serine peptidase n=1 Tax=Flavihumibacter sp. ZG627 TaxID=1463156 RepID=UPI00057CA457|nr:prolyl oligopeptidase family serine peptidase [Flavihumibacter sp. ZG627]KIC91690.1 prolyl endopeptidase [Flavihumibacter sp. ZG627]
MRSKNIIIVLLTLVSLDGLAQLNYPETRKTDTKEDYHGIAVEDPYRWLEDDNSEETRAWVKEQNKVTFSHLDKISFREDWKKRMLEVSNYEKTTAPNRKGEYYYYYRNNGLQNQSVLYRRKGLTGAEQLVIDPNKLSADGTTRMTSFSLSKNGRYAVYALSKGGSDWQSYRVRDLQTGKDLADQLEWVKVSGIAWQGNGFYYSRYPATEKGKELSTRNENHQVYYHKIGSSQKADQLIYEDAANPQRFHIASTSEDERFLILNISDRGKGFQGNALWIKDSKSADKNWKPLVKEPGQYLYSWIDNFNDRIILRTNDKAPNYKLVVANAKNPDLAAWEPFVEERNYPMQGAGSGGGKLFLNYLENISSHIYIVNSDGTPEGEVNLPGIGSVSGFDGNMDDKDLFYTFSSYTYPPTIFRYDIATEKSSVFKAPTIPSYDPKAYETKQVFYPSKDGTRVPMFITHKKGIELNGENPVLLYAYGGFNISMTPGFSAVNLTWLEQGGVYAVANLRGGSELGEKWHEAGMLEKKQNVFDDFIAAAEYLVSQKYTNPKKLAIQGGSNGALLIGAVINQRPDLFGVAIPQVGVMDMLRYQKFTIGWNWIAEYGSSEKPEHFPFLYKYSPIHNIREGIAYPPTIITTADHDDRVVPAHSFKYAATLQEKYKGENPVIIRIDTNSGHGASNLSKSIELYADLMSFAFYHMGLTPKFN